MRYVVLAVDPSNEFPPRILTRKGLWGTPGFHLPEIFDTRQEAEDEISKRQLKMDTRKLIVKEGGY